MVRKWFGPGGVMRRWLLAVFFTHAEFFPAIAGRIVGHERCKREAAVPGLYGLASIRRMLRFFGERVHRRRRRNMLTEALFLVDGWAAALDRQVERGKV
jgi:hypothetical protein